MVDLLFFRHIIFSLVFTLLVFYRGSWVNLEPFTRKDSGRNIPGQTSPKSSCQLERQQLSVKLHPVNKANQHFFLENNSNKGLKEAR